MRRTLFYLISSVMMIPAFAQSNPTKKVAILEVVDKEGSFSRGVPLMISSNLAYAITNTPGYEGYDRVDIASIMNEQEFQRTGLVSDTQIKKLGEMTGADYILVAEVAKLDNSHIIIASKILNVESAKLIQTSNVQTSLEPEVLEKACRELAARLRVRFAFCAAAVGPSMRRAAVFLSGSAIALALATSVAVFG